MSDPGIHAIERPAFVISHSARNVVGGATPLVNNYRGLDLLVLLHALLVQATISLLDVPTILRITVAKGVARYCTDRQVRLHRFDKFL